PPPPQPEPLFEPRHRPPPLPPQQERPVWQPVTSHGQWLPAETPGSQWASVEPETTPAAPPPGRRRRARHASPADQAYNPPAYVELAAQYGESGRRSRHSAEHRDHDIGGSGAGTGERPPSPPMAPPPPAEPTRRHRTADTPPDDSGGLHARDPLTGGQSVADLMARLQVESTGGGRRRRRGE
ncbi:hypothetical protein DSJ46_03470, partial [Mycobacterium tuberculosis]